MEKKEKEMLELAFWASALVFREQEEKRRASQTGK